MREVKKIKEEHKKEMDNLKKNQKILNEKNLVMEKEIEELKLFNESMEENMKMYES